MAATALDLMTKPKLLDEIKSEFAEYSKDHPYKSFLPEGAKPPLDLNKELMDKYRDAMLQSDAGRKMNTLIIGMKYSLKPLPECKI